MTRTTVTCDRCKNVVASDRTELVVESGPKRRHRESIDLCPPCCAALGRWLDAPAMTHAPAGPLAPSMAG